jgi:hypothetical protein
MNRPVQVTADLCAWHDLIDLPERACIRPVTHEVVFQDGRAWNLCAEHARELETWYGEARRTLVFTDVPAEHRADVASGRVMRIRAKCEELQK